MPCSACDKSPQQRIEIAIEQARELTDIRAVVIDQKLSILGLHRDRVTPIANVRFEPLIRSKIETGPASIPAGGANIPRTSKCARDPVGTRSDIASPVRSKARFRKMDNAPQACPIRNGGIVRYVRETLRSSIQPTLDAGNGRRPSPPGRAG